MSIPSIPEIYSIYFHASEFLFLTLWHFKTKEMWFVAAVYTLLTCCMLLGWCGPVGGQHVAPACVCVWNSRDLSGYAQECVEVWGDKLPPHRATEAPSAKAWRRKAAFLQTSTAFFADSGPYFCLCGVGTEGRRRALLSSTNASLLTSEKAEVRPASLQTDEWRRVFKGGYVWAATLQKSCNSSFENQGLTLAANSC